MYGKLTLFTKLVCLPKREGADYGKDTSLLYIFLALWICLIIHYQNVFKTLTNITDL